MGSRTDFLSSNMQLLTKLRTSAKVMTVSAQGFIDRSMILLVFWSRWGECITHCRFSRFRKWRIHSIDPPRYTLPTSSSKVPSCLSTEIQCHLWRELPFRAKTETTFFSTLEASKDTIRDSTVTHSRVRKFSSRSTLIWTKIEVKRRVDTIGYIAQISRSLTNKEIRGSRYRKRY